MRRGRCGSRSELRTTKLRKGRTMPPGARGVIVAVAATLALAVSVSGAAAWSNYFGPGTMYASAGSDIAVSGWNNWTNNRVYRPLNYNFYLATSRAKADFITPPTTPVTIHSTGPHTDTTT